MTQNNLHAQIVIHQMMLELVLICKLILFNIRPCIHDTGEFSIYLQVFEVEKGHRKFVLLCSYVNTKKMSRHAGSYF